MDALTGSSKQLAWGTEIRTKFLAKVEAVAAEVAAGQAKWLTMRPTQLVRLAELLKAHAASLTASHTDAGWWIDNRGLASLNKNSKLLSKLVQDNDAALRAA